MWTADAQAYERVWFTCQDKVETCFASLAWLSYPNLGTAEAFGIVNVRGRHTTVRPIARWERPDGHGDWSTALRDGFEPFKQWRLQSLPNDFGISFDLSWFEDQTPIFRQLGAGMIVGGPAVSPIAGYDGSGRQEGWIEAHGERFAEHRALFGTPRTPLGHPSGRRRPRPLHGHATPPQR